MKTIQTWKEWVSRWDDTSVTFEERLGLLHCGLVLSEDTYGRFLQSEDNRNRILFYLKVADVSHIPPKESEEEKLRLKLAAKAKSLLVFSFFQKFNEKETGYGRVSHGTDYFVKQPKILRGFVDFFCGIGERRSNWSYAGPELDTSVRSKQDRDADEATSRFFVRLYHLIIRGQVLTEQIHRIKMMNQLFKRCPSKFREFSDLYSKNDLVNLVGDVLPQKGRIGLQELLNVCMDDKDRDNFKIDGRLDQREALLICVMEIIRRKGQRFSSEALVMKTQPVLA